MRFFAYLYQFKSNLYRFFQLKRTIITKEQKTTYADELRLVQKNDLRLRCKKAAQEIQYLGRFSHWPIAKVKVKIEKNSLIYLDVSRSRRTFFADKIQGQDKIMRVFDKTLLSDKRVKRLP
ncbi:hypothetical protein CMT41_10125 [Colwellia sp. MT41]|uniref:hypothetical protein n=1 Tax=Colwellia sp. MT41 TaxID=58049 RepID=UPI000717B9BF|nr:hypothetical protein [Colwellia sp. MT41]ALO35031.1 hypothetical protein CMT41_10125 [Colwellia sp. MT41]